MKYDSFIFAYACLFFNCLVFTYSSKDLETLILISTTSLLPLSLRFSCFSSGTPPQERRAEFARLRDTFCAAAVAHFDLLFADAARRLEKQIAANQVCVCGRRHSGAGQR